MSEAPPTWEAVVSAAEQDLSRGDAKGAEAAFLRVLRAPVTRGADLWLRSSLGACVAARRLGHSAESIRQQLDETLLEPSSVVSDLSVPALLLLADLHAEEGESLSAERCLLQAQRLSPSGLPAASCAHRLGALYASLGRFDEAESFYDLALEGVRQEQGSNDPALGALLDELASVYAQAGRGFDAEAALAEAAEILSRSRPADSALQAQVLLRLGTLRMSDGGESLTQALLLFHEAYALLCGMLGDQHPLLAVVLEKLAAGHLRAAELEAAEAFAQRALKVTGHADGPALRSLTSCLTTLAAVAFARGQRERAIELAEQALADLALLDDGGLAFERTALQANLALFRG